ncbi:MAG: hypothetical protein AseanaTS_25650 [Candidatus Pelagadaptatus aseana]
MKKTFAISALSLAIAAGNVHANAPQTCVAQGGQGESLAEWGMWCGVGSFLAALSEMDPTAAGPEGGPDLDLGVGDPTGRGEADGFEPTVTANSAEQHIQQPAEQPAGQLNGYFAGLEIQYDGREDSGYGATVGGFSLSMEDGYEGYDPGYGEGYGEDIVSFAKYDADGNLISEFTDGSNDNGYYSSGDEDQATSGYRYTYVTEQENQESSGNFSSYGSESRWDYNADPAVDENDYESIYGNEVYVYQESDDQVAVFRGLGLDDMTLLKGYWAGYIYQSSYDYIDGSGMSSSEWFIAGTFTALNEIQDMVSGDVSAVYTGNSHRTLQSVRLEVDFGGRTFEGDFGDIEYSWMKDQLGIDQAKDMSFSASGVIDGVHLISTEVSADEGFVQGSFFGENGDIVGGAYDVTIDGDRVTDVFTAVEGEGNRVTGGPS